MNFLITVAGKLKEYAAILSSAGAGDSGKIPGLDAGGKLDLSFMPTGVGPAVKVIVASEALAAGDFVNVYSNAGTLNVRKADASSNAKEAHGFVLASVLSLGNATVYFSGINAQVSGLTIGVDQYLSAAAPGTATATAPTGTGKIVQQLGVATAAAEMLVEIQGTVELV